MTVPQKWAIRNVARATFYNIATGKPLAYLNDLKTSGVENTAETVYARGGDGNAKIVGFSSNREARINLENAVFDNRIIALMTGNELVTGSSDLFKREIVSVSSDKATLSKTPQDTGALIGIYELNSDGTEGLELSYSSGTPESGQYSYNAKVITLAENELADGSKLVVYYKTETDATAQTITVSSNRFSSSFKLVLDCIVRSTSDKQDYAAQIQIPACRMEDNWNITMSAEGDPSVHTIPIEVLKPDNGDEMWTMTVFDESLVS